MKQTYYVNLDSSWHPELSATNTAPFTYTMDGQTYAPEWNAFILGKIVYFPPTGKKSTSSTYTFGTQNNPYNWHQFLVSLRFDRIPGVDVVEYVIKGERVLTTAYDGALGNWEKGFDVFIGFNPSHTENNVYCPIDGSFGTYTPDATVSIVFRSWGTTPFKIYSGDFLNGPEGQYDGAIRFALYTKNLYIYNGMIQTSEGVSLARNSDIVFERFLLDKNIYKNQWVSVNDLRYDDAGGRTPDEYSYLADVDITKTSVDLYRIPNMNVVIVNSWINASGFLGLYMSNFKIYNSTIRSDFNTSCYKNQYQTIEMYNTIFVSRDATFEQINPGPFDRSWIKPFRFGFCVVCPNGIGTFDQTGSFVQYARNVQWGFGRGVIVNEEQLIPHDNDPPPESIFTSAVTAIQKEDINYLESVFGDISITGNQSYKKINYLGFSGAYDTRNLSIRNPEDALYTASGIIYDGPYAVWYNQDEYGIEGAVDVWTKRDGIGALWFPTFSSLSFSFDVTPDSAEVPCSPVFSVIDGSQSDFINTFKPSSYFWQFGDESYVHTDNFSVAHQYATGGQYAVSLSAISFHSWYGANRVISNAFIATDLDATFTAELLNVDGSSIQDDILYVGSLYIVRLTNTCESSRRIFATVNGMSNLGAFANTPGGIYDLPISMISTPCGARNISVVVKTVYGTYISNLEMGCLLNGIVTLPDNKYYVDLGLEYENAKWVNKSTASFDDFEDGIQTIWSNNFNTKYTTADIWGGDHVAVANNWASGQFINLIYEDSRITHDFDMEFSMVRGNKNDDLQVKFNGSLDSRIFTVTIQWDYMNRKINIIQVYDGDQTIETITYPDVYPKALECDSSLKTILFKVTASSIFYKLNGVGEWVGVSGFNANYGNGILTKNPSTVKSIQVYVKATQFSGFGYIKIQATQGLYWLNGGADLPLSFTEFVNRIKNTGNTYSKYLCRGYRSVPNSVDVRCVGFASIDAWDSSLYGPWILAFAYPKFGGIPRIVDFAVCQLSNGVIYNLAKGDGLVISNCYDMFIVWQKSNDAYKLKQYVVKWGESLYSSSKIVGSTIRQIG